MKNKWITGTLAIVLGACLLTGCGNSNDAASGTSQTAAVNAETSSEKAAETAAEASAGTEEISAGSASIQTAELAEDGLAYEEYVVLPEYKGLALEKTVEEVTDETVDEYLASMLEQEEVTDPEVKAENGDTVMIIYVGKEDGIAFDGGSTGYNTIRLGDGVFSDEDKTPVFAKGLEDAVIGMKVGETKEADLKFIDDYSDAELAGKDVHVQVTLSYIEGAEDGAAAKKGDTVGIVYVGSVDGRAVEGCMTSSTSLKLGSGSYISGFEEGLVGAVRGETRDLTLSFPEDYFSTDLAGKEVVFTVTVESIYRMPEMTDEWVQEQTDGQLDTVEAYRGSIREMLEQAADDTALEDLYSEVWTMIRDGAEFKKLPESYVDEGKSAYDSNVSSEAESYGVTVEALLEQAGVTDADYLELKASYGRNYAASKVLLNAMIEAEGITSDLPEYDEELQKLCDNYGMTAEDMKTSYGEEVVAQYVYTQLVMRRVISYADITTVTGEAVSEAAGE